MQVNSVIISSTRLNTVPPSNPSAVGPNEISSRVLEQKIWWSDSGTRSRHVPPFRLAVLATSNIHRDGAAVRFEQTVEMLPANDGLAGTVSADEPDEGAGHDADAHVVKRCGSVASFQYGEDASHAPWR